MSQGGNVPVHTHLWTDSTIKALALEHRDASQHGLCRVVLMEGYVAQVLHRWRLFPSEVTLGLGRTTGGLVGNLTCCGMYS